MDLQTSRGQHHCDGLENRCSCIPSSGAHCGDSGGLGTHSDVAESTGRVDVSGRRGCAGWGLRGGGDGVEGVRVKLCPTARLFPTRTHAVSVSTYSIIKLGQ